MTSREVSASSRFNCTVKERAIFEAGIKMGTIYHQFVGSPVSLRNVESLERTIEETIKVQPYVSDVKVKIDRSNMIKDGDTYSYFSLIGEMIDAVVKIRIDDVTVTAEMRYDSELKYPLMYISNIE